MPQVANIRDVQYDTSYNELDVECNEVGYEKAPTPIPGGSTTLVYQSFRVVSIPYFVTHISCVSIQKAAA